MRKLLVNWSTGNVPRSNDCSISTWRTTGWASLGGALSRCNAASKPVSTSQRVEAPQAELDWWYQYYFATERGRAGYGKYRVEFAKLIWHTASPKWRFDDATFERSAQAFDNADHVDLVLHNYRWRLGLTNGESRYDDLERQLAVGPRISVPTITLERRCQRCAAPRTRGVRTRVLGQVRAPPHHRWHRSQPAAGSAARVR